MFLLLSFLQKNYHTFYRYSATLTQLKHKIKLQKHQIQTFSQINWKELIVREEEMPPGKLQHGPCPGLSSVRHHTGGAPDWGVSATVPLSADPAAGYVIEEGLQGSQSRQMLHIVQPQMNEVRSIRRHARTTELRRCSLPEESRNGLTLGKDHCLGR